jgi:hypothetical protein
MIGVFALSGREISNKVTSSEMGIGKNEPVSSTSGAALEKPPQ